MFSVPATFRLDPRVRTVSEASHVVCTAIPFVRGAGRVSAKTGVGLPSALSKFSEGEAEAVLG